jgi:hypothetical protein
LTSFGRSSRFRSSDRAAGPSLGSTAIQASASSRALPMSGAETAGASSAKKATRSGSIARLPRVRADWRRISGSIALRVSRSQA